MIHHDGCRMCGGAPDAPALNSRGEPCPCRCHTLAASPVGPRAMGEPIFPPSKPCPPYPDRPAIWIDPDAGVVLVGEEAERAAAASPVDLPAQSEETGNGVTEENGAEHG